VFQNAEDHVAETGATLLMTEFADVQDPTIHRRVTELADEFMVGWTVWGWFRAAGQIKQDPAKPPTPDNLNQEVLAAVVRPYPRIVAGTPTAYGFDPETKRFEASFSTRLPNGRRARRRRSEIFIPRLHYGRDYHAVVRGAKITRGLGTQRVELRARRRAKTVTITVTDRPPN
jgi:endoglycosylceramidase